MSKPKKIVDAKEDAQGNITAVRLQGNRTFTPAETAFRMAQQGRIDAVPIQSSTARDHIRTRPDGKEANNLDEMAKKH